MESLEVFEKLKGELRFLFHEGNNLDKNDENLMHWSFHLEDPGSILGQVRGLKEEGNLHFKQGEVDTALDLYGCADFTLSSCAFSEKNDRRSFCDLAYCILLNVAACLLKKKDFQQVGYLCSIILDFNPCNTKALFRRACATIEIGRNDLAYWDLLSTSDIEPSNKDIKKKFDQVKAALSNHQPKDHFHNQIPLGMGVGLPSKDCSLRERSSQENGQRYQGTQKGHHSCFRKSQEVGLDNSSTNDKDPSIEERSVSSEGKYVKRDEKLEDKKSKFNLENSNLAEPKYRFLNRRRPGSSLMLSKRDYHRLQQGKTINSFNRRTGSYMVIRVISLPTEDCGSKGENQEDILQQTPSRCTFEQHHLEEKERVTTDQLMTQESQETMMENAHTISKGVGVEVEAGNFMDQHRSDEASRRSLYGCSSTDLQPSQRCKYYADVRRKQQRKSVKRKLVAHCKNAPCFLSNVVSGCRRHIGVKRKYVAPLADCLHLLRKKSSISYCVGGGNSSACFTDVFKPNSTVVSSCSSLSRSSSESYCVCPSVGVLRYCRKDFFLTTREMAIGQE